MDPTWLIEPFGTWDAVVVFKWYVALVIATILLAVIHDQLGVEFEISDKLEKIPGGFLVLFVGGVMPLFEEVVFRGIPAVMDASLGVWIAGTAIWALLHKKRALIIAPMGILFLKLWLSGFWIEAIIVHALHNTFLVGLLLLRRDIEDIEAGEYDGVFGDDETPSVTKIEGEHSRIVVTTGSFER